jgi:hypothetical protein
MAESWISETTMQKTGFFLPLGAAHMYLPVEADNTLPKPISEAMIF